MTRFGPLARGLAALCLLAVLCVLAALGLLAAASLSAAAQTDPLPSWNDGAAKAANLDFVARATDEGGPDFVPPAERIAAFDQDGTLWVEQPLYTEFRFALDRVPEVVKAHPELGDKPAFQAVLSKDPERIRALGARELFEILLATMSGMTPQEFADEANAWLAEVRDPRWHRPYTDLVYQPMQEVLALLRANGFRTFIATGGNVGFVTPYSDRVYGIPPEQVSGSAQSLKFEVVDGKPRLVREPKIALENIEAGKIENFEMVFGVTPRAQFGNSSSDDQQALQYVKNAPGLRLSVAILHDDAAREYAYGPATGLPDSPVGTFSQEMYDLARNEGWVVVSMKDDWKRIFTFDE